MNEKDYQRKKNKFLPKIHAWYGQLSETFLVSIHCLLLCLILCLHAFVSVFFILVCVLCLHLTSFSISTHFTYHYAMLE